MNRVRDYRGLNRPMRKMTESRLLLFTGAVSVATAALLITVKLAAWYLSGSVAVLASFVLRQ